MKEKILKPAEHNYKINVVKYYEVDTDPYICTTGYQTDYGSVFENVDIILTDYLPNQLFFKRVKIDSNDNWMIYYLCGKYTCINVDLNIILRKILTAMPD